MESEERGVGDLAGKWEFDKFYVSLNVFVTSYESLNASSDLCDSASNGRRPKIF